MQAIACTDSTIPCTRPSGKPLEDSGGAPAPVGLPVAGFSTIIPGSYASPLLGTGSSVVVSRQIGSSEGIRSNKGFDSEDQMES